MIRVAITGTGAWGPGVRTPADIGNSHRAGAGVEPDEDVEIPRPAIIPARELRRSPKASRLGVEVAMQACTAAGQDTSAIRSVFTSALGDSDITDYMCRILAGQDKLLSPTKFHNSVHNAAAGCWSIACENPSPTTFVAAFADSANIAFFEALTLVASDAMPTLFVAIDVPVPGALASVHGAGTTAAIALLLEPERDDAPVCVATLEQAATDPEKSVETDPARSTDPLWPLIGALSRGEPWAADLRLGTGCQLVVDLPG